MSWYNSTNEFTASGVNAEATASAQHRGKFVTDDGISHRFAPPPMPSPDAATNPARPSLVVQAVDVQTY